MTDEIEIPDFALHPVPEVVDLCRYLLTMAESGRLRGIAVATATPVRDTGDAYVIGSATIADLYLGIERVKGRLLAHGMGPC